MNINPVLKLNPKDDVVIARQCVPAGTWLEEEQITVISDIPAGHKIALRSLNIGEAVKRYGQIIGFATQPIRAGEHIHMHNLGMGDFERDYAWGVDRHSPPAEHQDIFQGIRRADGRAATRNYIGILVRLTVARRSSERLRIIFVYTV